MLLSQERIFRPGLPISYASSSDSDVIQVVGGGTKLKVIGGGTATITVSQAGSVGYNPAPTKNFTVNVTEYSPYSDSIPGMTLWLDANDVNGDGLSKLHLILPQWEDKHRFRYGQTGQEAIT